MSMLYLFQLLNAATAVAACPQVNANLALPQTLADYIARYWCYLAHYVTAAINGSADTLELADTLYNISALIDREDYEELADIMNRELIEDSAAIRSLVDAANKLDASPIRVSDEVQLAIWAIYGAMNGDYGGITC